jgi:predicted transcriptional regulator
MYCFVFQTVEWVQICTWMVQMIQKWCNELENSVERTRVPRYFSECKLMQYNVLLCVSNRWMSSDLHVNGANDTEVVQWTWEQCRAYQSTTVLLRKQAYAVQCTALCFKPLNGFIFAHGWCKWYRISAMNMRTVWSVPKYHGIAQNASLCSTMYCFVFQNVEWVQICTWMVQMIQKWCNELENSVERTRVPRYCSECKLMQYNVLLCVSNPGMGSYLHMDGVNYTE